MQELLGRGIYTIPEASRLARIDTRRIRRWLLGYPLGPKEKGRRSPAVVPGRMPIMDGVAVLNFLELQELRCVRQFLGHGVTWTTLRAAHAAARAELQVEHPFSIGKFVSFGQQILYRTAQDKGDAALLNLVKNQRAFAQKVLGPFLKGVDIEEGRPDGGPSDVRLDKSHRIVIDPARSFGQPIVAKRGVPTAVLAAAVRAEQSVAKVARWFEVDPRAVRDAVRYEHDLAA